MRRRWWWLRWCCCWRRWRRAGVRRGGHRRWTRWWRCARISFNPHAREPRRWYSQRRMRIRLAGLLLGLGSTLLGQSGGKPIFESLRSGDPLQQAWAAHWIVEEHAANMAPELLRILDDSLPPPAEPTTPFSDAEAARLAILDALIQMRERVPLATLEPLVARFPTEVLILAARSSEDNTDLLLRLLERPHSYAAFVAVGNLLTPRRAPGFAVRALKEFDAHVEVMVFSPGQDQNLGSGWAGDGIVPQGT